MTQGGWSPSIPPSKDAYKVERIQLLSWPAGNFQTDRQSFTKDLVGFHIYGLCPSCKHHTTALCAARYLAPDGDGIASSPKPNQDAENAKGHEAASKAGLARSRAVTSEAVDPSRTTQVTVLRCACLTDHSGPDGTVGCGTDWLLRVTYSARDAAQPVELKPVPAEEAFHYWYAAEDIATDIPKSLVAVRATAGTWATALTALLTAAGFAAVLTGRDTIKALSSSYQVLLGIAAAIAVVANLAMLYLGDLASLGFPKLKKAVEPRALRDADLEPLRGVAATIRRLKLARLCTGVAVTAGLVALGIFLFAPAETAKPLYKLTVVMPNGVDSAGKPKTLTRTTACGDVGFGSDAVTLTVPGTPAVSYPLDEVSAVEAC